MQSYVGVVLRHGELLVCQHPPSRKKGIDHPKTACGCSYGRVIKKKRPRTQSAHPWNAFVSVQLHVPGNPWNDQLGNATTTTMLKVYGMLATYGTPTSLMLWIYGTPSVPRVYSTPLVPAVCITASMEKKVRVWIWKYLCQQYVKHLVWQRSMHGYHAICVSMQYV